VSAAAGGGPVGLVTGGASGIGLAIARHWIRRGVRVAVVDREGLDDATLEARCTGTVDTCRYHAADVRDHARAREIVQAVVAHFGRLDYVVANAGITRDAMVWRMSEADWDDVIGVNLKGAFNYASAAAPVMRPAGVTVNVVAPGLINTTLTKQLPEDVRERAVNESALARAGEPADVAEAVDWLCGEGSRHVTGVVLRVDGGQMLAAKRK